MKPTIIVNNPGYSRLQKKLVGIAFSVIHNCPPHNKSRHVSILCHRNKIISVGINNERRSHPLSKKIGNNTHSELNCIIQHRHYDLNFNRMSMYNIRITRHNEIKNSKPCKFCTKLLEAYEIKRVYYTDDNGVFIHLE